ncbi:hypothetical protein [Nocardia sp. NPDC057440]|uniref:hypothetical protein n=1 Tax=Nocardia sp. NPDC057440 TaxID=3346134 RepID=UPI00366BB517
MDKGEPSLCRSVLGPCEELTRPAFVSGSRASYPVSIRVGRLPSRSFMLNGASFTVSAAR